MTDLSDLGEWLARRSVDQLAVILDRRPDTTWGVPLRGLDDLAARLMQPASVLNAISSLPLPGIELTQALSALGPRPTVEGAADLLDAGDRTPEAQVAAVGTALSLLEEHALAWRGAPASVVAVNPGVRAVVDRPLGLGRAVSSHLESSPVAALRVVLRNLGLPDNSRREDAVTTLTDFLTDHRLVRKLLATAPDPVRRRMAALCSAEPEHGYYYRDQLDREGESWARSRGLLFGGEYYAAEVPIEVILAVRGSALRVVFDPEQPALQTVPVSATITRAGAAAQATEFTETVAAVLDSITRTPIPELKAGGIGARELTRTAKSLGLDEGTLRVAFELIRALGLLAGVGVGVGVGVGAGEPAGPWRTTEPSARFADLAVAWWGLPITPSLTHDPEGKAIPTIGGRTADGTALNLRSIVLHAIGKLPPAAGLTDVGSLAMHLRWQLPRDVSPGDVAIAGMWTEAHLLGVLTQGALTPIGAALLQGEPDGLLAVAADLLPSATSSGRFGSDLTVMVAGSPTAAVSALLDSCADRESRGAAIVWRFSPASIRRALDDGIAAASLVSALGSIAETGLPQPLTYLIADVQRRHGTLIVQPALCCVRSDDEALLIEVAAHRSLRSLRPHLLAPTVITFQGDASSVVRALRAAGYMPVPADEHGVVRLGRGAAIGGAAGGGAAGGGAAGGGAAGGGAAGGGAARSGGARGIGGASVGRRVGGAADGSHAGWQFDADSLEDDDFDEDEDFDAPGERRMVDELSSLHSRPTGIPDRDPELAAALRDLAGALLPNAVATPDVGPRRGAGTRLEASKPGAIGLAGTGPGSAGLGFAGPSSTGQPGRIGPDLPNPEPTVVEEMIEDFGQQLDPVERRQLAYAINNQVPVTIMYRSASGGTTTRTISDIELIGGLMYAWCHLRDDERAFTVDRVQAVAPVNV